MLVSANPVDAVPRPLTLAAASQRGMAARADTVDIEGVVSAARGAQAAFERRRIRYLPISLGGSPDRCDEVIGRICTTWDEGEWYPEDEDPAIVRMRRELIEELDSLQAIAPSADWILGQRIWYRVEAGDAAGALEAARRCGEASAWWCAALRGFSLHALGRYEPALVAFEESLSTMDPEQAERWRFPRWSVDRDARERLEVLAGDPEERAQWVDRLWLLADPLYLAPGNDRRTEHYARWAASAMRAGARNPFLLPWGSDLEQLTVRNGWEMGWERRSRRGFVPDDDAIGHNHPQGRDYMPPGEAVDRIELATPESLHADRRRPRSLYAPPYAPVLLPMEAEWAVFPRGETTVVVASSFLPEDTTYHVDHEHPRPWMEPGEDVRAPDRIGLFVVDPLSGTVWSDEVTGRSQGSLAVEVPSGEMWISIESWSPSRRRAGRLRAGVPERRPLEDLAMLSDLVLLRPGGEEPSTLEEAVPRMLPRAEVEAGEPFAIGWEVAGLGFRDETLEFGLSVERVDRGFLSKIGGFLGLSDRPPPLELGWEEPSPDRPGHEFRYLALDLPPLEPGLYRVRLVLRTLDRSDAVTERTIRIRAPR